MPDEELLLVFWVAFFPVGVLDDDVEHFREVLAEAVGGGALDPAAGGGDVAFAGCGEEAAGEFLFFGFAALDGWDGEEF